MHELALCSAIFDIVEANCAGHQVVKVEIEVGAFRQVVPATLVSCWEMLIERTALRGAELVIFDHRATVSCRDCCLESMLAAPVLRCAGCGSRRVRVIDGGELRVVAIEVETTDVAVAL